MPNKNLELVAEKATFNKDGKDIPYKKYFVNISGVNIEMFTRKEDYTAKKLLKEYYKD